MKKKLTEVKHPRGVSLAHMIRQGHIFTVSSFTLDKLEDANASVTISVITFARSIKYLSSLVIAKVGLLCTTFATSRSISTKRKS